MAITNQWIFIHFSVLQTMRRSSSSWSRSRELWTLGSSFSRTSSKRQLGNGFNPVPLLLIQIICDYSVFHRTCVALDFCCWSQGCNQQQNICVLSHNTENMNVKTSQLFPLNKWKITFVFCRFKKRVLIEQLENFLEEIHNRSMNMNHVDPLWDRRDPRLNLLIMNPTTPPSPPLPPPCGDETASSSRIFHPSGGLSSFMCWFTHSMN